MVKAIVPSVFLLSSCVCVHALSIQSPSSVDQIRNAMSLTTIGQTNITTAISAVQNWEEILYETKPFNFKDQPLSIRVLCNCLYASSLSRIGRDRDAFNVHEITLSLISQGNESQRMIDVLVDIRIGRGEAMQRLLQYDKAQANFAAACELGRKYPLSLPGMDSKLTKCAYSAAVCALRRGHFQDTVTMLAPIFKTVIDTNLAEIDPNLAGMYGILLWEGETVDTKIMNKGSSILSPIQLLEYAASSSIASPVYKWFYALASNTSCDLFQKDLTGMEREAFLQIASINQSPFDDFKLLHLDDKVLLYTILQSSEATIRSWPLGFILPRDQSQIQEHNLRNPNDRWILKDRAGYGSHGNQIVACDGDMEEHLDKQFLADSEYNLLCQKLIEPSLLYDGRKFSIRVYVVYFQNSGVGETDGAAYLLNQGLVKLAESEYDANNSNDGMYMTNSGRIEGDAMIQYNFDSLRTYMIRTHGKESFEKLWDAVEESVSEVMKVFAQLQVSDDIMKQYIQPTMMFSTVPKIMGFDYIIDTSLAPWLMEVNRFPGLEARGAADYTVKNEVVETAWKLASRRSGVACGFPTLDVDSAKKLNS